MRRCQRLVRSQPTAHVMVRRSGTFGLLTPPSLPSLPLPVLPVFYQSTQHLSIPPLFLYLSCPIPIPTPLRLWPSARLWWLALIRINPVSIILRYFFIWYIYFLNASIAFYIFLASEALLKDHQRFTSRFAYFEGRSCTFQSKLPQTNVMKLIKWIELLLCNGHRRIS